MPHRAATHPLILALAVSACLVQPPATDDPTTDRPTTRSSSAMSGDTATPAKPETEPVLVIPHGGGLGIADLDGTLAFNQPWNGLVGSCTQCGGEGASPDGDGLLVSFTAGGGVGGRDAIARLDGALSLDFRLDGFSFPHDVIRDPADDTIMVVETFADRVAWLAGDGSSAEPLRELASEHEAFPPLPNGAERLDYEGGTYLLLSHLGTGSNAPSSHTGKITLWDIGTPGAPALVWSFPESGTLSVPHGPILRERDGVWWLLWAHTHGDGSEGTVGMATSDDPLTRPVYVADLQPDDKMGPFAFFRGVELSPDGTLLLVDSGFARNGRLIEASWPDHALAPSGSTGGRDDRTYLPLGEASVLSRGLRQPFEAWLWDRPSAED